MSNVELLAAKGVSKYFKDGSVNALEDINLSVKKGEMFGIKGPSGSGKSTLLHILGGLDSPSSGEVYFEGRSFRALLKDDLFRIKNMGFVFQAFYLWPTLNVFENVLLPLVELPGKDAAKKNRAGELLEMVGLGNKSGAKIGNLSIGERQRVSIARALAAEPKAIFADEPTGSLDSKNTLKVLDLFKKINNEKGTTIIMVTHDKAADGYFHRSVSLSDGRIA